MLDDSDVQAILNQPLTLEQRAQALIDDANQRGGVDNTTVVLLAADS
jgi:serine/threonine protein phosphatase PrpC